MGAGLTITALTQNVWIAYLTYGVGVCLGAACTYLPTLANLGGTSVLGRLGIGGLSHFMNTLALFKCSVAVMAASYIVWLVMPAYAWLVLFAAILGVAYGLRIALVPGVLIELFGHSDLGSLLGKIFHRNRHCSNSWSFAGRLYHRQFRKFYIGHRLRPRNGDNRIRDHSTAFQTVVNRRGTRESITSKLNFKGE